MLCAGYTKLESTVRYLGIDVDNALKMSEETVLPKLVRFLNACMRRGITAIIMRR